MATPRRLQDAHRQFDSYLAQTFAPTARLSEVAKHPTVKRLSRIIRRIEAGHA